MTSRRRTALGARRRKAGAYFLKRFVGTTPVSFAPLSSGAGFADPKSSSFAPAVADPSPTATTDRGARRGKIFMLLSRLPRSPMWLYSRYENRGIYS